MKRIGYEWLKLTWNRILLVAVLLCMAAALLYQWQNAPKNQTVFEKEAYQSVLTQVMNREPEEALTWIEGEAAWHRFLANMSYYAEEEGFLEQQIQDLAETYGKLTGQSLGLDYSEAPVVWSESMLADALILILVLLVGWQIFCREREDGLYPLLLGTKNGRLSLAWGKIGAYFTSMAVMAVLMYGGQMILAFLMYGTGNMTLPLASLSDFRDCPYQVSIAQYAVFYLGIKILGVLLFGGFAMVLLTCCRKYGVAVCLYFLLIALEYFLYARIDSASPFNGLKYLNLAAVLDAKAWFSMYWNLNLFSYPISVMPGKLIFGGICLIAASLVSVWGFCRRTQRRSLPFWNTCMAKVRNGIARIPRPGAHGSLFLHEGFKLYRLGGMLIVLLVLTVGSVRMADGISG